MESDALPTIDGLEARLEQAKDLEFQGKFVDSESAATEAIGLLDNLPLGLDRLDRVSTLLFEAYSLRGIVRRMQGRRDEALRDYEEAMDYTFNDGQRALTYVNVADIYRGNKEFGKASQAIGEALVLSQVAHSPPDFPFACIKAIDQLGLVRVAEQDFESAIRHYHNALKVFDTAFSGNTLSRDETRLKANVLQHLAIGIEYAKLRGQYTGAFALHAEALGMSESIRDMVGILNVVTATARLYARCGRHDDALALYEKAWRVVKDTDYERGKATVLLHLAHSQLAIGGDGSELSLGIEYAVQFVDAARKGAVPPGDYKGMVPYVDEVARLSNENGINVVGLSDIQQRFHQQ